MKRFSVFSRQFSVLLTIISLVSFVVAQDKFLGNIYQGLPDQTFAMYFNQITPENAGKWGSVEFSRDTFNWASLDIMFKYAAEQGMPVKHHTFVWGQQEPPWMADLPADEQRAEVIEWMEAFAERYPDVAYIDVVNEAQHAPPSYKDAIGGDGETGWDWMIWAFEKTRELYPDAVLLINDYNILCCANDLSVYRQQISILQERGLVDGIGVQAHGLENVLPSKIQSSLDSLAEFGLPIYVSELELREYDDEAQQIIYEDVFPVLWEHPVVAGVTLWGYKAGQMWRPSAELLDWFDEERPALTWLVEYLDLPLE